MAMSRSRIRVRISATTCTDLRAAVGPGVVLDIDPDRAVEFANTIDPAGDMQFGAESDLEEPVDNLGVGKGLALDGAPAADLVMFRRGRNDRRGGENEDGDGGGDLHDTMRAATSGRRHGGGHGGPQCSRA